VLRSMKCTAAPQGGKPVPGAALAGGVLPRSRAMRR
jgi:hypothetical protein